MEVNEDLKRMGWHLTPEGLARCTELCKQKGLETSAQNVEKIGLDLDLREIGAEVLPKQLDKEINKVVVLQIQRVKNVAMPSSKQHEVNPSKRLLRIFLTDGHTYHSAVELGSYVDNLSPSTEPGTKMRLLQGRAPVESGFFVLSNFCVAVLGGRVEHMLKKQQVIPGTMDRGKATGAPLFMPFKQVAKQATLSGPQVNVKSTPPPSYDAHKTSRSQAPPSRSQAGRSVQRGGGGAQQHTRHKHTPTPKMEYSTSSSGEKGAGTRQQHTLPGSVGGDGTRPPPHPSGEGRRPQMGSLTAIAAENSLRMSAGRPERGRGLRTGRTELDDGEERRGRRGRGRRGSRDDEHTSSKGEYQLSDWFSQALHLDTAGEEQEESSNVTSAGFEERGGYYEGEGPREPVEDSSWSGRPRRGRGRGQHEERGRGGRRGRRGRGGYQRGGEQDLTKSVQEVPYSGEGEVWPTLQGTHAPLSRANDGGGGGQGSEIWRREKPAGKEEGTKGNDPVAAKHKDGGRRGREAAEKEEELYIWEDELIYYEDDVVSEAWPTLQGSSLPSSDGDQRAGERGMAQKSGELWRVKPTGVDRGVKEQDAVKGKKGTNKDGGQAGQWRGGPGEEEPEVWESELYFEDVSEAWPTLQGKPLDSSKDGGSGRQDAAGNWDWVSCKGVPSSAKKVLS